jgi:hypothetical protein
MRAFWNWLRGVPMVYPPWDLRVGPEVFCHWMTTGGKTPVIQQIWERSVQLTEGKNSVQSQTDA